MERTKTQSGISRRDFLSATGAITLGAATGSVWAKDIPQVKGRPNILIIITDQLAQKAVRAYGDKYAQMPNIDSLAKGGVRFCNVYTTCPLCQPARASFWTGLLPHQTRILSNAPARRKGAIPIIAEPVPDTVVTLGEIFKNAGYQTEHFGKRHDMGTLRGFRCDEMEKELPVKGTDAWPVNYDTKRDRYTTTRCVEFLSKSHDKPFLAVADLNNPHNICGWVGANMGEHTDKPIPTELPPLPDNFEIDDLKDRPIPIQYLCCSGNRQMQAAKWNKTNYRHYLAAYYHYINRLDSEIGLILDALNSTPAGKNTLIVFMADHGDNMAAHHGVTKRVSFYEETTRVPLIFTGPGVTGRNISIDKPLVSLLDLLPTLCDYAGLATPKDLTGLSLLPYLQGKTPSSTHEYVVSQWYTEFDYTTSPGRMLRTKRFKYTRYIEGGGEELYELANDPGEKRNLATNPDYADTLNRHRQLLKRHVTETKDNFFDLPIRAPKQWRSHKPGYHNHTGPAANTPVYTH